MSLNFRDIDDLVLIKKAGVYQISRGENGRSIITIHRFGQPEETIYCLSPGHANQVRQELSDKGMVGLVGDAL